jgi:hypothetical protein
LSSGACSGGLCGHVEQMKNLGGQRSPPNL